MHKVTNRTGFSVSVQIFLLVQMKSVQYTFFKRGIYFATVFAEESDCFQERRKNCSIMLGVNPAVKFSRQNPISFSCSDLSRFFFYKIWSKVQVFASDHDHSDNCSWSPYWQCIFSSSYYILSITCLSCFKHFCYSFDKLLLAIVLRAIEIFCIVTTINWMFLLIIKNVHFYITLENA